MYSFFQKKKCKINLKHVTFIKFKHDVVSLNMEKRSRNIIIFKTKDRVSRIYTC